MAVHDVAHHGPEPIVGGPQSWRSESMCRKHPTNWWFAGGHSETALAKSICGECGVRSPCLEFALSRPDLLGIWAATTPTERSVLRRESRERVDAPTAVDDAPVEVAPAEVAPAEVGPRVPEPVVDLIVESDREGVREVEPGPRRGPRVVWRETVLGDRADLLTPAEAARKLGVTPNTVTRWSRAGKIAAIQTMGGHRRFRRTEIERLLREATLAANQY